MSLPQGPALLNGRNCPAADRPWLDVLSKADLLPGSAEGGTSPETSAAAAAPAKYVTEEGSGDHFTGSIETQEIVPLPLGSVVDVIDEADLLAAVASAREQVPLGIRVRASGTLNPKP